jgi:UDP-glucose 4-epimerase
MKIIVIGGAGYIGSIVTEQLVNSGHQTVVFDNLVQGHVDAIHPGAEFFRGDVSDLTALEQAFANWSFDAVIDLAGETIVTDSMTNPYKYFKKNVVDNLNVLECMVKYRVPRIIFSSSSAVYGEPEVIPIPESHPMNPGNSYGESKLIFEQMLKWYHQAFNIRFCALRYFNAVGASRERGEDHRPETHLIPLVLNVALEKLPKITVFGNNYPTPDGTCIRGYTHVEDLAEAHVLALTNLDKLGSRIYNVGTLRGYSVLEVIQACREITGKKIPDVIAPRRPGDVSIMIADSTSLRSELGWRPQHEEIHSMIETAWRWNRDNPNGYSN